MSAPHYADISAIQIKTNRQRREFAEGELQELAESIRQRSLLHAPVLREEGGSFILVAGERRLRAIKDIYALGGEFSYAGDRVPFGFVPYITLGELSRLEAMEAELEENIRRTDLTWQERAAASAALLEVRTAQAESAGADFPTVADIAVEVRGSAAGYSHTATRNEIILAKHLHDPDIKSAKTADEAFKILKRKESAASNALLAEKIGRTFTSAMHRLMLGNAHELAKETPPESFDVILTDPPYGMGADDFGDSGGKAAGGHLYADSYAVLKEIMAWLPGESFRLAKPLSHLYCFCDIDNFLMMKLAFSVAGWEVFRTPLTWFKPSAYRAPWPENGPQRKTEWILYAMKGKRKVTRLYGDLLEYSPDENLGHQAQKPVALFADLLTRSVNPGDSVLDLFCGTGPIFPAAHALKCKATGFEQDPGVYGIAAKRLEGLK